MWIHNVYGRSVHSPSYIHITNKLRRIETLEFVSTLKSRCSAQCIYTNVREFFFKHKIYKVSECKQQLPTKAAYTYRPERKIVYSFLVNILVSSHLPNQIYAFHLRVCLMSGSYVHIFIMSPALARWDDSTGHFFF